MLTTAAFGKKVLVVCNGNTLFIVFSTTLKALALNLIVIDGLRALLDRPDTIQHSAASAASPRICSDPVTV